MQVSVEQTSELSRKMTVSIPEEVVMQQVSARLKSLSRQVNIAGFRPGKIPQSVIQAKYGAKVRQEVTGNLLESSYYDALKQQNLNVAGNPKIYPLESSEGFSYTAEFEVYPTVTLSSLESIEATQLVAQVEDADFEEMIQKLRVQKKSWHEIERPAQENDRITLHFSGVCEGENFTEGKVENYAVEIGSKQMIPGFEEQLIGLRAGDSKSFEITFPQEYSNEKLAGKLATFEIEAVKVEEGTLPDVDEEFVKQYGVESGDVETFKHDVRKNMERELERVLKADFKHSVFDGLYAHVNLAVPGVLVDQDIATLMTPYLENAKKHNLRAQDLHLPREMFEPQAKRRVALSLILGEIIDKQQIKIDENQVRAMVESLAQSYENPTDLINWYYADNSRLNDVRQVVLEDQIVDWLASQIKITQKSATFTEVMNKQRQ